MADTFTTNLNLTKPEPGAAEDTWGISLNSDLDTLDAIFSSSGTQINLNPNQINFGDNKKAIFGAGSDLQIYHDGNHSRIVESGGGDMIIQGDEFSLMNVAGTEYMIFADNNSFVKLYYDGSNKLATTSAGINVTGIVENDGLRVDSTDSIRPTGDTSLITISGGNATNSGANYSLFGGTHATLANIHRWRIGGSEAMRLNSTGLGIGTSSPDSKLHVDSGVSSTSDWGNLGIISDFPINVANRIYTSYLLQDSEQYKGAGIGLAYDGTGYKMHFATASSPSSGISTQMTIDRNGNVGIGTTSPTSQLNIKGTTGLLVESNGSANYGVYIESSFADTMGTIGALSQADAGRDGASISFNDFGRGIVFKTNEGANNSEAGRFDSSGNFGIGVTPAAKLDVLAGGDQRIIFGTLGTDPFINAVNAANSSYKMLQLNGSVMRLMTGGSERARIDSSGNFLVAQTTQSPNTVGISLNNNGNISAKRNDGIVGLFNRGTSDGEIISIRKDDATIGSIGVDYNDNLFLSGKSDHAGIMFANDEVYPYRDGNYRDATLDLGASSGRWRNIRLSGGHMNGQADSFTFVSGGNASNAGANILLYGQSHASVANTTVFRASGSETARITSAGHLLIGKTSVNSATTGSELRSTGKVLITQSDSYPLLLNRTTSDGTIINLRKDNTTVGNISNSGTNLIISGSGTNKSGLYYGDNALFPVKNGSLSNSTIGFGSPNYRFSDLYLSGGAYLGGTTSANHLDDYEEGTFTPVMTGVTGWSGSSGVSGTYTKIGNTVHVFILMTSNVALTGTAGNTITGLPFSASTTERCANVSVSRMFGIGLTTTDYIAGIAGTEVVFSYVNGNNNVNNFTHTGSTLRLTISATYTTT